MVDLNSFTFTQESDVVETLNDPIQNNTLVKTLNGDDEIESTINSEEGFISSIFNNSLGIINMGGGNDSLTGVRDSSQFGMTKGIVNGGTILMGRGNDFIKGMGELFGIDNVRGTINTGQGNDSVEGIGEIVGIDNVRGTINTGQGNDSIQSTGSFFGIDNARGIINTGTENDFIEGIANANRFGSTGINNTFGGTINTGIGNDSVKGSGEDNGINNTRGIIRTGQGDDLIEGKALLPLMK